MRLFATTELKSKAIAIAMVKDICQNHQAEIKSFSELLLSIPIAGKTQLGQLSDADRNLLIGEKYPKLEQLSAAHRALYTFDFSFTPGKDGEFYDELDLLLRFSEFPSELAENFLNIEQTHKKLFLDFKNFVLNDLTASIYFKSYDLDGPIKRAAETIREFPMPTAHKTCGSASFCLIS